MLVYLAIHTTFNYYNLTKERKQFWWILKNTLSLPHFISEGLVVQRIE